MPPRRNPTRTATIRIWRQLERVASDPQGTRKFPGSVRPCRQCWTRPGVTADTTGTLNKALSRYLIAGSVLEPATTERLFRGALGLEVCRSVTDHVPPGSIPGRGGPYEGRTADDWSPSVRQPGAPVSNAPQPEDVVTARSVHLQGRRWRDHVPKGGPAPDRNSVAAWLTFPVATEAQSHPSKTNSRVRRPPSWRWWAPRPIVSSRSSRRRSAQHFERERPTGIEPASSAWKARRSG
jgi:hypothetical protein